MTRAWTPSVTHRQTPPAVVTPILHAMPRYRAEEPLAGRIALGASALARQPDVQTCVQIEAARLMDNQQWLNRIVGEGAEAPDQLLANPFNARIHPQFQQDALLAVLDRVGWIQRVIVNRSTGNLLDGHLRVLLAMKRRERLVPVEYVELTEDEEKLVLATFDPITGLAAYDKEVLDALLKQVNTDSEYIQEMLANLATDNGLYLNGANGAVDPGAQVDKAAELQQKWQVQRGDVWQIGKHRLLCGDSTNAEDVARVMAGERAALAWFDPPFGSDLQPQRGLTDAIENDGNEDARRLWSEFLPLLETALRNHAHVFLCQGWTEFDWTLPLIRRYFHLKSKIVWRKNVWGIGYYTRPQHEDIIYCWKGEPETPLEAISDVWEVARESAPVHAAEKPPELSSMAIKTFSKAGDIVADWFCGVGGSLVACHQLGRQGRGIEISENYCAVILERMSGMGIEPTRI